MEEEKPSKESDSEPTPKQLPTMDEVEEWKPTPDLDKPELIDFEQHADEDDEDDEDDDYDPRRDGCKIF
jgi:hypothetical protein